MNERTTTVDLLQGTLAALILKALSWGPLHGYGIARWIEQVTEDDLLVEEGSLYPALHRLEQEGWLRSAWGVTEKNREARFYTITAAGRKQLAEEQQSWQRLIDGVGRVLQHA